MGEDKAGVPVLRGPILHGNLRPGAHTERKRPPAKLEAVRMAQVIEVSGSICCKRSYDTVKEVRRSTTAGQI